MRYGIIGAGMAGLSAAQVLRKEDQHAEIHLFDKGRGAGGRMATKPFAGAVFDYGAQFMTAQTQVFSNWIDQMQAAGAAKLWTHTLYAPESSLPEKPRYIGAGDRGMRTLTNAMADALKHDPRVHIHTQTRIISIVAQEQAWHIRDENEQSWTCDALLCTAPVPQAQALLEQSNISLTAEETASLERLEYAPCIAVLARFDQPSEIPHPGGISFRQHEHLFWIADNAQRGLSPHPGAITIHANPAYSQTFDTRTPEEVRETLIDAVRPWCPGTCIDAMVHFWRYSLPTTTHPDPFFKLQRTHAPLLLAGDIFGGPRVEGAFLSGRAAAEEFLRIQRMMHF